MSDDVDEGVNRFPSVAVGPYLLLTEPVAFGPYWLGPLDAYAGPWQSDRLRDATNRFAAMFRDGLGDATHPALLARSDRGVDGMVPSLDARLMLQAIVTFAVIDTNPVWSEDVRHQAFRVVTADNADLWFQPLDLVENRITVVTGSRVTGHNSRQLSGTIDPPLELFMGGGHRKLDGELLEALYLALAGVADPSTRQRMLTSLHWHEKAWLNSNSISDEDRLIFLRIALEVLVGSSNSSDGADVLGKIFGSILEQPDSSIGLNGILWSPSEPCLRRTYTTGGRERSEERPLIEHWFMALASARNEIVHDGTVPSLVYEAPGSPYSGPFIETADRVYREAVKVMLGGFGFPRVWRTDMGRASLDAVAMLRNMSVEEGA